MEDPSDASVVVPHTALGADLLQSVIESFVLREGTDYGEREFSLEAKVAGVVRQLERGEAHIVFDPRSDSVTVVREFRKAGRGESPGPGREEA